MMEAAGIGGFFMHARGGLQTPYMEEEWFENVTASVEEAEKLGVHIDLTIRERFIKVFEEMNRTS